MTTPAPGRPSDRTLSELIEAYRLAEPVLVTRPTMPDLAAYQHRIERIWESRWLTNDGELHGELTQALTSYLGVEHLSLCCNGTVALLIALQACGIGDGEVITTPFTFPATPHSLHWNRVRPTFCDIEDETFNLDPDRVEALIGPETRAILPVHVFGYPCDVDALGSIADKHGLEVIYDAAHAMGVRVDGRSILDRGSCSVLSFHATKLFSTIEGGAIVARSASQKERIDFLRNFGIADENTVIGPGINGKMNEFQAAFGLLQLQGLDQEIASRRVLTEAYRRRLAGVPGIRCHQDQPGVRHNYAYFPILVDEAEFGMSRDELHRLLQQFNVFTRKYFHPLCSTFPGYSDLPSAAPSRLPVAHRVAARILCLPLYGTLPPETVEAICSAIDALSPFTP